MIRSLLIGAVLVTGAGARAETGDVRSPAPSQTAAATSGGSSTGTPGASSAPEAPAAATPPPDTSIDKWRSPVDALNERLIGSASRAVRFDWRKSKVGFALIGSELLERNNFGSTRLGLMARHHFGGGFSGELGVTRAFAWSTDSSDKLALTPYRQFGRPSRFELDVNGSYALAEGVVTAWPSVLPPAEMVFSAHAGFRYLFYPGAEWGSKFITVAKEMFRPQLTERELAKLEPDRLPGMQIDEARYSVLAGFSLDIYFQPGAFITPRVMVSLPLLTPVNGTGLGFWYEMTLGIGWAI